MSNQINPNLHHPVLMAVACNSIMLSVCDDLSRTTLYKQDRKQRINALTKDLEGFMATFYKDIDPYSEQQYMTLVRTIEVAMKLITQTPIEEVSKLAAFLDAWQKGQFVDVDQDRLEGMLKCGMLKLAA